MRSHAKASSAGSTQRHLIGAFSALVLLLVLIPSSASAITTRVPLGFSPIDGSGTGVTLHFPSGIAVDETSGNVFLNDGGEGNVTDIFGAEGGVPTGVASPYRISGFSFAQEPSGVAVDNSAVSPAKGALYVVDVRHNQVKKFVRNAGTELYEAAGELDPTSGPNWVEPLGAAVDSKGNVFVADYGSSSVVEFSPAGTQLDRIDVSGTVERPSSVALDSAGDLFVQSYNNGSVYKYTANGSGEIEAAVFTEVPVVGGGTGVAVDRDANQLFVGLGNHVTQYDATSLAQQLEFGAGVLGSTTRIAVNSSSGHIYVSDKGNQNVAVFGGEIKLPGVSAEATTALTSTKATLNASVNPDGLAVTECKFEYGTTTAYGSSKPCEGAIPADSSDHPVSASLTGLTPGSTYHFRIVATNADGTNRSSDQTLETHETAFTEDATQISDTAARLNGSVNPDGLALTECKFEYDTSSAYGSTAPCAESSGEIGAGSSPVPVHADISGLASATTYHFRLLATNAESTATGEDLSFTTAGPAISTQAAEGIGTSDATVSAKINPRGASTTYHVEYGTTTSYGQSTPESLPVGFEGDESQHTVSVHIGGLTAGTAYHFRFVATSPAGSTKGPDVTFATYSTSTAFGPCPNDQFRTGFGARLSDCRAYEQATPVDKHGANPQGSLNLVQASVAGDRVTFYLNGGLPVSGGSSTLSPLMASRTAAGWSSDGLLPSTEPGFAAEIMGWSDDLSSSFAVNSTNGASYLRDSATAVFQPGPVGLNGSALGGFAADTSHLIFESYPGFLPGGGLGDSALFDLDHGDLTLAGRIPAGSASSCDDVNGSACVPAPEGSFAGPYNWEQPNTSNGGAGKHYYTENTISRDGSKVFFTAAGSGQLYVREDGTSTTRISASQASAPDPNGEKPAAFVAATPDGSEVFFLSCEKLTDDSTAVSTAASSCAEKDISNNPLQGQDLYSYDTDSGELTDLTVDPTAGDPKGAAVQGILGISEDGSYVYFVANGVLAPDASPGSCLIVFARGNCNLYVAHEGTTTFITSLSGGGDVFGDRDNWRATNEANITRPKDARVSADGDALLFRSTLSLTGYQNTGPCEPLAEGFGQIPCAELFRYSASDEELSCVSCNPSGVPPSGAAALGTPREFVLNQIRATFLTRNLSADGNRVFFDSPDALVPTDTNGVIDTYEWEAAGTGSCESKSQNGGCIYLLSSGTSSEPSWFADASRDGEHALFFTDQQLVPGDKDQIYDIYDAGVGAGLTAQHALAPPTCAGVACQANPAPPPDQPASSAVFSGPGNAHKPPAARKCPKGKRKIRRAGKVRCQKASKAKQHKRHSNRGGSK